MYSKPRRNVIESDEGFSVEILGLTGLNYCEGEKCVRISSELSAPWHATAMTVFRSSIHSWAGEYSSEIIDDETREKIIENIRSAFRWQRKEIEVL